MSESNPKSALRAIFPKTIEVRGCVSVYPLTLAHYALLEKINSYLVNGDHVPDSIETIKTMYICTHDARTTLVALDNLDDESIKWAEELPPGIVPDVMAAIKQQIDAMMDVVPNMGDNSKKKAATES